MGAYIRPLPRAMQQALCERGIHTKYKAVEIELGREFPGVWKCSMCLVCYGVEWERMGSNGTEWD